MTTRVIIEHGTPGNGKNLLVSQWPKGAPVPEPGDIRCVSNPAGSAIPMSASEIEGGGRQEFYAWKGTFLVVQELSGAD